MELIAVFLIGLCIGSFFNVVIYRVPLGKSIVYPPSSCVNCDAKIPIPYLIPILGYLLTRGRCFSCSEKISFKYPLVELLGGVLGIVIYIYTTTLTQFILHYLFFMVLVAVTVVDLEKMIIPDSFNLVLTVIGVLEIIYTKSYFNLAVGFSLALFFFLIAVISKGGMGGGDIKLAFPLGLFLGGSLGVLAILLAFFIGGTVGVILLALGQSRKKAIPFAPYLVLGTTISYFFGEKIIRWYLQFFQI
ncbi:type 4 prepilin peptidase 1 Aspartic peptidase. MEROPS family A24A [Anaerobranca californiensis DSM 14826]|jgi:prepilin signal peptidase PulO-like enzyme (type II secretory pathway)|uniref:Type 4 prepilin peptidase 1 Aspartic peptidase. MEROPS family A24A n=1 Tax=Anaerobranca californiensis DSM 14826 TaxID=1120989 RepID=A0A1M6LAY1_9FIRM|nr:A24 family peptidase [Anaerobranca californiensis]SHJ68361.1 type 4 prepilin peptidase 1 Aspartic peptidase. MEROPS family A24A [Anaerobranca californiensis DSM 14826]